MAHAAHTRITPSASCENGPWPRTGADAFDCEECLELREGNRIHCRGQFDSPSPAIENGVTQFRVAMAFGADGIAGN